MQSCHSMTGEKRLNRWKVEDRLEEEVWGSLKKKRLEESEVEGKLLEVKLAANVILALRFKDGIVEKELMTTVEVAVEDIVSSFRVHTSPSALRPRRCPYEIVNHINYFGVIFHVCTWWWIRAHSNSFISFHFASFFWSNISLKFNLGLHTMPPNQLAKWKFMCHFTK